MQNRRDWVRLHEKGGKVTELPCHHNLDRYIEEWITGAGLSVEPLSGCSSSQISGEQVQLDYSPEQSGTVCASEKGRMHKHPNEDRTSEDIAALPAMNKAELLQVWERTFSAPPPAKLRKELMVPILAYRMQETVHGGMSQTARTRLQRLIGERSTTSTRASKERSVTKPVSKLVRSWGGEIHEVLITGEGYVYRGEVFRKLSPIAKRITGTQWSGPAFFGTKTVGEDAMNGKAVRCAVYTRKVLRRRSGSELQFPARPTRGM